MRKMLLGALAVASLATLPALPAIAAAGDAKPTVTARAAKKCHSSYRGRCLKPTASDYDCAGGSGNGPYYVSGPFQVVGSDPFRLDSDHDGIACES